MGTLSEQSRPRLQVEDIRAATGGDTSLLDARDLGFFTVDTPNFWERPEIDGYLRDVRTKPDKYQWLERTQSPLPLSSAATDTDLLEILHSLKQEN